jgi:hypothetical protein
MTFIRGLGTNTRCRLFSKLVKHLTKAKHRSFVFNNVYYLETNRLPKMRLHIILLFSVHRPGFVYQSFNRSS